MNPDQLDQLTTGGPLLLAVLLSVLAGLVSFASPCVVPLVPGYLSYLAAVVGVDGPAAAPADSRVAVRGARLRVAGAAALFVAGFTAVFVLGTVAVLGMTTTLITNQLLLQRIGGVVTIFMGLVFIGLVPALQAGRPVALPQVNTFADGAAVARIGERTFERLRGVGLANTLTINEDRLCLTILEMLNVEGIVLEPAGALSVDALQDLGQGISGRTVVCITSGGNFDFERLPEVKERGQRYSGVKKYFILRLPQRPGALKDFLGLLGPEDDIARFEYLKKSARNFGSVLIGIETSVPGNFRKLFDQLDSHGFTYQDITEDEILAQFVI